MILIVNGKKWGREFDITKYKDKYRPEGFDTYRASTDYDEELRRAYIAGLVDGEGHIGIDKSWNNSLRLRVSIYNNNKTIFSLLGGYGKIRHDSRKHGYHFYVDHEDALGLLLDIIPYLISKQKQAKLAIKYQENKSDMSEKKQLEYKFKIEKLNSKYNRRSRLFRSE